MSEQISSSNKETSYCKTTVISDIWKLGRTVSEQNGTMWIEWISLYPLTKNADTFWHPKAILVIVH